MKKYLRAFKTQAEYLAFTASTEFILDNVSSCREGDLVYYTSEECGGYVPPTPPPTPSNWDITAKFNVTDTNNPTQIGYYDYISGFSAIEIDGVEQSSVVSAYTFSNTGEHTVKYKITDSTSIGKNAFFNCTSLTRITIPNSVTNIGEWAFYNCSGITSIDIPNSVITIGSYAFNNCSSLTSCTIGSGVTSIDAYAFEGCKSLTGVDIPDSVTTIEQSTFNECSALTSVTIGSGVTSIDYNAFSYCRNLTSITIPDGVTSIGESAFVYCSNLTSITIPDSVTSIGDFAFNYCSGATSLTIGSGVTSIGASAFYNCRGLTSVTVEATTPPTLGSVVFSNTNNCPIYVPCDSVDAYKAATNWSSYSSRIQAIPGSCEEQWDVTAKFNVTDTTYPIYISRYTTGFSKIEIDGVEQQDITTRYKFDTTGEHNVKYKLKDPTSIGSYEFNSCYELTDITIGSGVTNIGNGIFQSCSGLTNVSINNSSVNIGDETFWICYNLKRLNSNVDGVFNIPSGTTIIGDKAFCACYYLTNVNIPSGVTSIGDNAFQGCSGLTSIDIPSGLTSIGDGAFLGCTSLTHISIPSGITSVSDRIFEKCTSLTSIDIPSGITSIGQYSFYSATSLTNIVIPSGVTSIGTYAFTYSRSLTSVTVNATTPPTLGTYAFDNTNNCLIYVPCDSLNDYHEASIWSNYASRMRAIPGSCSQSEWDITATFNVTNTSSTKVLSAESNFSKIEIDGVEQQNVTAYYSFSTTGMHTVKYKLVGTSINYEALRACTAMTTCVIGDNVTSIASGAFQNCSGMTSFTIGSGVTSIGVRSLGGCYALESLVIPDNVTFMDEYAIDACNGMTACTIGSGITQLKKGNFWGCSGLTSITIPSNITSIGTDAFKQCYNLKEIICLRNTAPSISSTSFQQVNSNGKLYVPSGSSGYNTWMSTGAYYLGYYGWTKIEQ